MWEQIRANRRRSFLLITFLTIFLFAFGFLIGEAAAPGAGIFGLGGALVIWAVQMGIYFSSPESFLIRGKAAKELSREDSPRLFNIVEEMKIAAGLPAFP